MVSEKQKVERGISDLVGTFKDPIIVMPGGWGDTLPDWIKTAITLERLVMNMEVLKGSLPTGTDAEAVAYLYTAGLTAPMDSDWTQIYLYMATKVYEKWRTKESGVTMPNDVRVDSISKYQEGELNRLKSWIYSTRTKARYENERLERREAREEKEAAEEEKKKDQLQFEFDFEE